MTAPLGGGSVNGPPTVINGVVFVGSMDSMGMMYALDAATGTQLWQYPSGAPVYSGPAVVNGVVYWGAGYPSSRLGLGNATRAPSSSTRSTSATARPRRLTRGRTPEPATPERLWMLRRMRPRMRRSPTPFPSEPPSNQHLTGRIAQPDERVARGAKLVDCGAKGVDLSVERYAHVALVRAERLQAVGGVEDVDAVQLEVHERLAGAHPRQAPRHVGPAERDASPEERQPRTARDLHGDLEQPPRPAASTAYPPGTAASAPAARPDCRRWIGSFARGARWPDRRRLRRPVRAGKGTPTSRSATPSSSSTREHLVGDRVPRRAKARPALPVAPLDRAAPLARPAAGSRRARAAPDRSDDRACGWRSRSPASRAARSFAADSGRDEVAPDGEERQRDLRSRASARSRSIATS